MYIMDRDKSALVFVGLHFIDSIAAETRLIASGD